MFRTIFNNTQRCVVVLLALVMCMTLASCAQDPPVQKIHTTNVIRSSATSMFEYGNFVYFSQGEIYRYNTITGELTSACLDPECEGKCPLHGGMTRIGKIADGKMYFYSFETFTHNINFGYQDLISGVVTILDTLSEYELSRDITFVNNGYFYYYAGILKDGGDAKKYDDYGTHLCRIPVSGGEREVLETPHGIPQMIVDGNLVMLGSNISVYDLETNLEKIVWNYSEHGFNKVSELSYVNGKIFALAEKRSENCEKVINEYTGVEYSKNTFLVSIDISTGDWMMITEEAVESFTVTDDRVYYYPFELRYLYVPENYEKNPDGIKISFFSATLYSRKHDGSDLKSEYTNDIISASYDYTVIDGKLYGKISVYDETDRNNSKSAFCTVDLATGEIINSHDIRN